MFSGVDGNSNNLISETELTSLMVTWAGDTSTDPLGFSVPGDQVNTFRYNILDNRIEVLEVAGPRPDGNIFLSLQTSNINLVKANLFDVTYDTGSDNATQTITEKPTGVPIPSTLLLFGLGFAGFAVWRHRAEKIEKN